MYTSIEIDFDVFKELTSRRKTPEMTENDVIRELLFGPKPPKPTQSQRNEQNPIGKPWVSKGVIFPHGTEFRAKYWGQIYYAQVEDGALVYEGKRLQIPFPGCKCYHRNFY